VRSLMWILFHAAASELEICARREVWMAEVPSMWFVVELRDLLDRMRIKSLEAFEAVLRLYPICFSAREREAVGDSMGSCVRRHTAV